MEYNLALDLKVYCKYKNISLDEFSSLANVDMSVISKIVNNKTIVTDELLEKIYDVFYRDNFDINFYKIEQYKLTHNVVLFHGAKEKIEGKLSLDYSRKFVDFGKGFYTGETYEQSLDFICQKDRGSVYVLDANYDGLKIKTLTVSLEWMIWIAINRGRVEEYKNTNLYQKIIKEMEEYDVIVAPIADNRMFTTINDFVNGGISSIAAINSIKALELGNQIIFKSEKALSQLKILDRLYVCKNIKRDALNEKINRINKSESFVRDNYRKYIRQGLYINEVFENEKL